MTDMNLGANENGTFPIISIEHLVKSYTYEDKLISGLHDDPLVQDIADKLCNAFSKWGFVYLTDHGIENEEVLHSAQEFFRKDDSFKMQFARTSNETNWGYVPFKVETFDKSRPYDLKECFNVFNREPQTLSNDASDCLETFLDHSSKAFKDCKSLALLLLQVLSPAVSKDFEDFLPTKHKYIGDTNNNVTCLRLLHYPAIKPSEMESAEQLRCGEHSDYGTITMLFQDSVGGLQVVSPTGEYVDAVPLPGSIIVNIGDLLQLWTGGKFKSTRHRVLIKNKNLLARHSMAFFIHPDNDVEISCVDGTQELGSVNSFEYLMKKFSETY